MIPLMSLMIGSYIFTRMIVLFGRDDPNEDKTTKILIKIFSLATIVITLYCVYSIIQAGAEIPSSLY